MSKHECEYLNNSAIIEGELVNNDEAIDIVDVDDVSVIDDSVNDQEENANKTFIYPSQADKSSIGEQFKCEKCDYESATRFSLNTHNSLGTIGVLPVTPTSLVENN